MNRSWLKTLAVWVPLALAVAGLLAYASLLARGGDPGGDGLDAWGYHVALVMSGVTCLAVGLTGRARGMACFAFAAGLFAWAAADLYWDLELSELEEIPYPSIADAGYLATIPLFFVGIGLLLRDRLGRVAPAAWFDAAIAALAAGSVSVALLEPALVDLTGGDPATVVTNLAYPTGDLVLVALVAGGLAISGVSGGLGLVAIGLGLVVWSVADAVYLYQEATEGYVEGWTDLLWPLGAVMVAAGTLIGGGSATRRHDRPYRSSLAVPVIAAAAAGIVLVWDHFDRLHSVSVGLAGFVVIAVVARLILSMRDNDRLLDALQRESITDPLTGLGNRRRLFDVLDRILAPPRDEPPRHYLAIFSLEGFKAYNETFGHPAGDALLRRGADRLARVVGDEGEAFRLSGAEFCAVMTARRRGSSIIVAEARRTLTETGEGFSIGAVAGVVEITGRIESSSDALRIADRRMQEEKGKRTGTDEQTQEILLRIFREREPALSEHIEGVGEMATEVGRRLGMDSEELDVLTRGAELHDVGKIAIPDEILHKPGPLDENEWGLMRRHTLIGERILGATPAMVPVARLVRSSHERWDGGGYPDGLVGEEIPLGARIITVCDSFDAMVSERPYRERVSVPEALAELRRCAGSQFDPAIVAAFCELVGEGSLDVPLSVMDSSRADE